eukprot:15628-Eustigmatos_ZCMA.PRE.1
MRADGRVVMKHGTALVVVWFVPQVMIEKGSVACVSNGQQGGAEHEEQLSKCMLKGRDHSSGRRHGLPP